MPYSFGFKWQFPGPFTYVRIFFRAPEESMIREKGRLRYLDSDEFCVDDACVFHTHLGVPNASLIWIDRGTQDE